MKTCTRPRRGRISAKTRSACRLRHAIQWRPARSTIRSCRRCAAIPTRSRKAATISREVRPVHSLTASIVSSSGFVKRLPEQKEELESAEEEVETPGPVLPHRRRRPIMVADEHNRVDRLESLFEKAEEPETDRRVDACTVLIGDNPSENATGAQNPIGLPRDLFHLHIEARVAAGDPAETSGVGAVYDVVGIRRIDHRKSSGLRREGP